MVHRIQGPLPSSYHIFEVCLILGFLPVEHKKPDSASSTKRLLARQLSPATLNSSRIANASPRQKIDIAKATRSLK